MMAPRAAAERGARPRMLMVGGWKEIYAKAEAIGVDLVAFDAADRLAGLRDGPGRRGVRIAIDDPSACLAAARTLHAERPFAAVVSFAEIGLASAAHVGEALGIPANPVRPVRLTRDKLLMREVLVGAGRPSVRHRLCASAREVAAFRAEIGGPIIVKPVDGYGSRGVAHLDVEDEPERAWRWCTADGGEAVLAEEYVTGPELSVDVLSFDGHHEVVAIAEKLTTGPPHFIELGHQLPARLDREVAERVGQAVVDLLDAVGQRHGPSHTEVRLPPGGGVSIIETQTRTGGDQIWEMVDLALGVDMHRATMEHLVFGCRTATPSRRRAAAIRYLTAEPMTLGRIDGAGRAAGVPGVVRLHLDSVAGGEIAPLTWSRSRLGYVLTVADKVQDAVRRAERARDHVRFVPRAQPARSQLRGSLGALPAIGQAGA
jgi:biotin carboxylase